MECQVRTLAFSTHRSRSRRSFAVVDLNPSTLRPADTDMDIPHPNIALSAIDVPLDPDGTDGSRNSGDDHVANLGLASVTGIAHLKGIVRMVKGTELVYTLKTGTGLLMSANLDPEARMVDQNSPVTIEPAGMLIVSWTI
jgi:hypothetical protein